MRSAITKRPIDADALLREVSHPRNGAAVLFLGVVREENDGREVTGIEYSAYEAMAERELSRIVEECSSRFDTPHVVAEHRIGRLTIGEVSVAIAAAHPHRAQAYDASRYVIEEVKKRLPIWKREEYVDGTREWVGAVRETGAGNRESAGPGESAALVAEQSADGEWEATPTGATESRFPIPDSR